MTRTPQELRAETRGAGVAPYERAAVSEATVTIGSPDGLAAVGESPTPFNELCAFGRRGVGSSDAILPPGAAAHARAAARSLGEGMNG